MILTPTQTNLVTLLQREYIIPKDKEDLLNIIKGFDEDQAKVEFILQKCNTFAPSIYHIFKDISDEEVQCIFSILK